MIDAAGTPVSSHVINRNLSANPTPEGELFIRQSITSCISLSQIEQLLHGSLPPAEARHSTLFYCVCTVAACCTVKSPILMFGVNIMALKAPLLSILRKSQDMTLRLYQS